MEEKINIAAILKDKSQGTKLYDWLHNIDIELDTISTTDTETVVWCTNETNNNTTCHRGYSEFGTERGYPDGLQILFPSKSMRDWRKFAWKKGDLLINSCGFQCIFKEWASDDYTKFNGCYSNSRDGYKDVSNAETANFVKLDNNTTYEYVKEIERKLGGKLNLKTLEIKKQSEFKDGDILSCDEDSYTRHTTLILHKDENITESIVSLIRHKELVENVPINNFLLSRLYYAREDEKKELFDALAKEGKAWDSNKKAIVDLKPKVKLKPFDKVIVRCSKADKWSIDFFSYKVSNGYICTGDARFGYCLPYNEETAHLLGTIDEWKGDDHD